MSALPQESFTWDCPAIWSSYDSSLLSSVTGGQDAVLYLCQNGTADLSLLGQAGRGSASELPTLLSAAEVTSSTFETGFGTQI
jgi:hypothetical protein